MMEALFCPVCMGEYLMGEVFEGEVPRDIPEEDRMQCQGATMVVVAGTGQFEHKDVTLHLPKVGQAAIEHFSANGHAALICRECYCVEPIDLARLQLV